MTRISVANRTSSGDTLIPVAGNSFVIESGPLEALAADRNVILIDQQLQVTAGIPLIPRLKYVSQQPFNSLFLRFVNGTAGTIYLLVFDSVSEDVTLPPE